MAAIDQKINLIGVPQVTQGLDAIVAKTKQATDAVNNVGAGTGGAAAPIQLFNTTLKNTEQGIRATTEAGHALAEGLHILRPILGELGVAMGGLGEFSRLASHGLEALGIAVAGAAAAKVIALSDEIDKAKGKLGDLLGSQAAGQTAFARLSEDAEKLGTSTEALLPAFQSLIRAGQDLSSIHFFAAPGQELPELISGTKQASDAVTALFTALRAGHASIDEANKTTASFANALQQAGALTKQVASILLPFPKAFDALKVALGASGQTTKQFLDNLDKAPKTFQQVQSALQQITTQIPATFDPKAPQSLADAITRLWDAVKEGAHIDRPKDFEKMISDLAPKVKDIAHDFTLWVPPAVEGVINFGKEVAKVAENTKQDITNLKAYYGLFKTLFTTTDATTFLNTLKQIRDTSREIGQTGAAPGQGLALLKKAFDDAATSAKNAGDQLVTFKNRWDALNQEVDTFKDRWDALGKSIDAVGAKLPSGFRSAPGQGQFGTPPGSKTVSGSFGTGNVFGGGDGGLATEQLLRAGNEALQRRIAGGEITGGTLMPHVFSELNDQAKQAGADAARIFTEAFGGADFSGLDQGIQQSLGDIPDQATTAAEQVSQTFDDLNFSGINADWQTSMDNLVNIARQAYQQVQSTFSQPLPAPSFGSSTFPGGFPLAAGGLVRGPGTATSDSILARLSAGEFVMTAAAVQRYGAAFFASLNAGMPRFAGGGAVSDAKTTVNLNFAPNASFQMTTSEAVATSLRQYATKSRYISIGAKPSWY